MQTKKGSIAILIIGLVALVFVLAAALLVYPRFLQKEAPGSESANRAIEPKTSYENPFDQKTQYSNPFAEYRNPFDNLE